MVSNLKDLMAKFSDEQKCRDFLVQQRWGGSPVCPYCGSNKWYSIENGKRFKCGNSECYKKYSVTVGTVFHASNIPLSTWFPAMYILTAHKKGISSVQLAKDLGVTQKTAWFINHRIRKALTDKGSSLLGGIVEVDETYVGGKMSNKHKGVRGNKRGANKTANKEAVIGVLERDGKLLVKQVPAPTKEHVLPIIQNNVEFATNIVTDNNPLYSELNDSYYHNVVHHSKDEFVRGKWHTNSIEGFFSQLKRQIYGIHHFVSGKHLQRYCDESSYRFNSRDLNDGVRFELSLTHIEGKLPYKILVNGEGKKDS